MRKTNEQLANPSSEANSMFEQRILEALARRPEVVAGDDFAARVARQAFEGRPVRSRPHVGWGPRIAIGSTALLTAALFALAPHATPSFSNMSFDGELLLLAELGTLLLFSRQLLMRDKGL